MDTSGEGVDFFCCERLIAELDASELDWVDVLRACDRVVIALRALALSRNDGLSRRPDDSVGRNLNTEGTVTLDFSSTSLTALFVADETVGLNRENGAVVFRAGNSV